MRGAGAAVRSALSSPTRSFTEAERQYLTETQSLTLDEAGREVLVGLIYDESSLLSQIVGSSSVRLAANGLRYANGSWPRS